jgi:hypothetical protein
VNGKHAAGEAYLKTASTASIVRPVAATAAASTARHAVMVACRLVKDLIALNRALRGGATKREWSDTACEKRKKRCCPVISHSACPCIAV